MKLATGNWQLATGYERDSVNSFSGGLADDVAVANGFCFGGCGG